MKTIHAEYKVTLGDFRKATYYALFLRHQKAIRIMFAMLLFVAIYFIAGTYVFKTVNPYVLFIGVAYLVWAIVLLAGAEKGIRQYMKSPNCLLGKEYRVAIEEHKIHFSVPQTGMKFSAQIAKLACVFELSAIFLIYISAAEVYILPHGSLKEEDRAEVRERFRNKLGDRFSTRFK